MAEKVLMKGNEALAEAAIQAGCRHYFGYPITPQTEIAAYMARRMPQVGGCFLQAESEIAAIYMVHGAACAGRRAMTSSSGPGISLKGEGLSYMAGSNLPALVVNVQRAGPGLGGIQPSQADYNQAVRGGGHGDYHLLVLAPASVQEMADLTMLGFDLSQKYRMVAMILVDGTLGQMMEPVEIHAPEIHEYDQSWTTTGTKMAREHCIINSVRMDPLDMEALNRERFARYAMVEQNETRHEAYRMDDAEICVVAFGIAARVAKNAVDDARKQGVRAGLIRPITLWPFPNAAIQAAAEHCTHFITAELSMGQMVDDVRLALDGRRPVITCNRQGGVIPSAEEICNTILNAHRGGAAK